AQKIEKVNFVRQRQGINYKVLLGAGDDCPVLAKLDVQKFPSLILVDETGHIVWRGEGMTAQNKARLEAGLRKRLKGSSGGAPDASGRISLQVLGWVISFLGSL